METLDLNQLVDQLSKTFDQCLENAISEATANTTTASSNDSKGTKDIVLLKSTLLELEYQLKDIKLETMQDKQLSVTESITLLKRDIDIKQATIDKYSTLLDNWMKILPELEQNSKQILNNSPTNADQIQEQGNTGIENEQENNNNNSNEAEEDDDDDDVEFEEI
ncbi:hypothetical protein BJ944DRAFT_291039 [Cunninghamella echinulata]|nr:hypothetical protein BJ944DRAFT_291039 [Cunninghamella echinulata]